MPSAKIPRCRSHRQFSDTPQQKTRVELEKQIVQLPCDILIVAMHNYSPEFLDSFTKVLRIRDGELEP